MNQSTLDDIKSATLKLLGYCQRENWAGYDPYDALNSRLFMATPFYRSKYCRIALTQLLKRLPINIRPFLLIGKEQNPKALALFLMAFVKLKKLGLLPEDRLIRTMVNRLIALRSPGHSTNSINPSSSINSSNSYFCWGYSFPWQGREVLVPKGSPNLVCTVFVANGLLDLHESSILSDQTGPNTQHPTPNTLYFDMALSAAEYILNELYWEEADAFGFSYPLPSVRTRVHNANFLAAALLCRVYKLSGDNKFLAPAMKAARYSASRQNNDGSWYYGEHRTQHWIDNFHTGYNLCALQSMKESTGTLEFDSHIARGLEFYRENFFEGNGISKYFHDKRYPIDVHSIAQSLITLLTLKDRQPDKGQLALTIFQWTQSHLCNGSGFFFYQDNSSYTNRISYIRWSQAWMLLALTTLLEATADN